MHASRRFSTQHSTLCTLHSGTRSDPPDFFCSRFDRVPCVQNQFRFLQNHIVVDVAVVGDDEDEVRFFEGFSTEGDTGEDHFAGVETGDVRIAERDVCPFVLEQVDDVSELMPLLTI